MRVALIFDRERADTVGVYFERACRRLGVAADHYWVRDAERIPSDGYDLYLRIDHGDYAQPWPARLRPSVFYAIDSHLPKSWRSIQRLARAFDRVACAQRRAAEALPNGAWVPLGCDLAYHGPQPGPVDLDLAFIGTDGGVPRKYLLQALRERYPRSRIGPGAHDQLGAIYSRAKIGVNFAIRDDVNMRVFEVLCSGALLLTNALPNDDFERLGLRDRESFILYHRPSELPQLIDHYLTHDPERTRIAAAGRAWSATQTYDARLRQLLALGY